MPSALRLHCSGLNFDGRARAGAEMARNPRRSSSTKSRTLPACVMILPSETSSFDAGENAEFAFDGHVIPSENERNRTPSW